MKFEGIKMFPILELGISQIYLNERKINAVSEWLTVDTVSKCEPLPVHEFRKGEYTLTDGHSRAYVAYQRGISKLPIIYDEDDIVAGKIGKRLYTLDIEWCDRFRLKNVSDLSSRIIGECDYQKLWINRCDRSYHLVTQMSASEREAMQFVSPHDLFLYGASRELDTFYFENTKGDLFFLQNGNLMCEYIVK